MRMRAKKGNGRILSELTELLNRSDALETIEGWKVFDPPEGGNGYVIKGGRLLQEPYSESSEYGM